MKKKLIAHLPFHLKKGHEAEKIAEKYLQRHGLKTICKNYRCRYGEIDLLMHDTDTLVFVEVRYRSDARYGDAAESITPRKRQKIRITAEQYLQKNSQHGHLFSRFDVIAIHSEMGIHKISWIKDAF